jgi:choline dehydrogenase-like flavoprotein
MAYTRAQNVQIDSWELLGNKGWNWQSLFPYYKKSEGFQVPTQDQIASGADYYAEYHGKNGPMKVGWPKFLTNGSVLPILDESLNQIGVPYNRDVNGGLMVGLTSHPNTIDREANIRQDAARAYYWPYQNRPNLKIITNTQANKIIWGNDSDGDAVASGVEVSNINGKQIIYASKEVILSAGSLKSPILLELSGIGNPNILSKYDIPVKVNIPAVGENLQDQTNNGLSYEGNEFWLGSPTFSALPSADHIYGDSFSTVASHFNSSLADYAETVANSSNGALQASNLLAVFKLQWDMIFRSKVPFAEIVFLPIAHSFSVEYWPLLPFSRGSIHIKSANASAPAAINPNYFMFEQDLTTQSDVAWYIRKLFNTLPLADLVGNERSPGLEHVPVNASESTWDSWVKKNCQCLKFYPNYAKGLPTDSPSRQIKLPPSWNC